MNKFFPILALLMFLGLPLSAQYRNLPGSLEDSPTVSAMKRHVSSLAATQMEGRAPGSEGEKMAAAYLREQFELEGIDVLPDMTFGISEGADTLVSLNVAGFIPGNDRKDRYIVIGARIDNLGQDTYTVNGQTQSRTYYGANGNASGMAMLLELGSRLSLSRGMLSRSVLLVGFGSSGKTLAGSWYMLNGGFADASAIDAMINLDILGGGANSFGIYTAGCRDLEIVALAMEGELLPVRASLLDA
ncbi:MAG: M28 family peptidase, partial [Bacteroidales bacterium]|nr:M28 family peptidase [Bacteroidales bacterium]